MGFIIGSSLGVPIISFDIVIEIRKNKKIRKLRITLMRKLILLWWWWWWWWWW